MIRSKSKLEKIEAMIKETSKTNRVFTTYTYGEINVDKLFIYENTTGDKEVFTSMDEFKEKYNINDSDLIMNLLFVSPKAEN